MLAQLLNGKVAQIDSIQLDRTLIRIIEAAQQLHQSAFAGAIQPHNRYYLSGGDVKREILECRFLTAGITEADTIEADPIQNWLGSRQGVSPVNHLWLKRQKLEQIAQKQNVRIELTYILQQRSHQALSLIKSLIEQSQVTQRNEAPGSFPHHPHHGCASDQESKSSRG